ncbi:hypothetical protein A3C23_00220 [Candidatus Roizmanbacteria bacterium RIFCSPHIGHO2_02_FULL_37_13b]|uniref:Uncharacterized protein n=1 Tax=Candidatus Roizmanbacteria bacterium RIFCSPLOWO2_02_FULL_36_11 TaxID=1802071 RepID=A0A1F7JHP1_9BACT|nr:MAG: hypothetical protein A3C23_00220 [Candidatus Roizmanbacteria bacterium RIFCSPHIGHO2_02_FULL_37_13b]OGK55124.1 MAG: hypothetical protein A3H78_04030 [Candidatus Roizmanbacteria bacterium RIFCSPLOWO2_02_FULL_36_11]
MNNIAQIEQMEGERLNDWYEPESFQSLKLRRDCVANLGTISRVIVVGSSGAGKSIIQRAVIDASEKDSFLAGRICIPRRVVTRDPRPDDDNMLTYCSSEELELRTRKGEFGLYGVKLMENGREELFGLEKPEDGAFPIFFANNAVIRNRESIGPPSVFDGALIVGIYAPDSVREERLRRRSPHLFTERPDEIAFRLSDVESSRIIIPQAHVIVKNFGRYESRVVQDFINFLKLVELSKGEQLLTELAGVNTKNRYIILRHGESEANKQGVIVSSLDNGLNDYGCTSEGIEDVSRAARYAQEKGIHVDHIFTSPFLRCTDSARVFAEVSSFIGEISVRDELRERYFGIFEGTSSCNYQIVYNTDQQNRLGSKELFGAETPTDVLDRVTRLITELEETNEGKTFLLVTHADVGEIAQAGFKGLPPQTHRLFMPKIRNGTLREIATMGT